MDFKEVNEIVEWFKNLLNVKGELKFKYTVNHYDASNLDLYDFEREVLTTKVLYFDTTNNVISTHSPYGSFWEKRKDVVKIIASENFRWCIKGEEYLSDCKPCYITLRRYDGYDEMLMKCNEKKLTAYFSKLKAIFSM